MPLFYTEALLSGLTAWLPREPSSRDRQAGETKRFQVSSNMERGTERQRGGDIEVVVDEKTLVERQWGEAEVLALMSVWDEVGAQHVADTRATFELISERLRRLSVMRSWWECQTKCRSLGLQGRRPDAAAPGTSTKYSTRVDARPEEGWEQELEDLGNQRRLYPSSGTNLSQEGK